MEAQAPAPFEKEKKKSDVEYIARSLKALVWRQSLAH